MLKIDPKGEKKDQVSVPSSQSWSSAWPPGGMAPSFEGSDIGLRIVWLSGILLSLLLMLLLLGPP